MNKTTAPEKKSYLVFVIVLLMLINTLKITDRGLLAPLVDPIGRELGLNDLQFGTIRSATDIALLVGMLGFGLLADRSRRRDIVVLGVVCWSAITWGTSLVQTYAQLLVMQVGVSFFLAAFNTSAYPMLSDLVPRRTRGWVMGLMGATFAIGTVVALVAAALLGTANWRSPFAYFGIPGLVLGLILLFFVREPTRGAAEDEVLDSGNYSGKFSWQALGQTLRIRTALLIYCLDGCQGATWWAFSFWAPAYLLRTGIAPDADTAALALLPAILGFVVGTILGGWLIDKLRTRTEQSALWVSLISLAGALVMSLILFALQDLTAVLIAGFLLGLFGYMIMPAINVMIYDVVPPETRSSASAADGVITYAVSALAAFAIGAVSHTVGVRQGLDEGNLRAGFQSVVTVLLTGGVLLCLRLLRTAPADMASLRKHVAARAGEADSDL